MEGYTSRRPGGRPAIMIMHPVNWGVGVPGIWGIRGAPGIMGTENGPSLRKAITVRVFFTVLISAILLGSCAVKQKADSAQAASTQDDKAAGEPPIGPNGIAREEYDRAVADYQNCLLANTANLSACEKQRGAMNAAATILFGPSSKRNTIVNTER